MNFQDIVVGQTYSAKQLLSVVIGNPAGFHNTVSLHLDVNTVFGERRVHFNMPNSDYSIQYREIFGDLPFRVYGKAAPTTDALGYLTAVYVGEADITEHFNFAYFVSPYDLEEPIVVAAWKPHTPRQVFRLSADGTELFSDYGCDLVPSHVIDNLKLVERNGGVLAKS